MALNRNIMRTRLREVFGDDTQETIAKKLNTTQGNISKILNGRNEPTTDIICEIAEKYHVSIDYLMGLSDQKHIAHRQDAATYQQITECLTDLLLYGDAHYKTLDGKHTVTINDPILTFLLKKSIMLARTDHDLYNVWRNTKLSSFEDKPVLSSIVWRDNGLSIYMMDIETESEYLDAYKAAAEIQEKFESEL